MIAQVSFVQVVLATRPLGRIVHLSKILRLLTTRKGSTSAQVVSNLVVLVTFGTLSKRDSLALAQAKLAVKKLPPQVQQLIVNKTQGHPLYIEEMIRSMVEEELVSVV